MKLIRIVIAIVFFILFFIWGTGLKLQLPFTLYFPNYHLILAACLVIFSFKRARETVTAIFMKAESICYLLFPVLGFVLALLINIFVFGMIPHIQDSVHYIMMAENFAKGQLHAPMHPFYEFFHFLYQIPDGDKMYSLFLPGFSFLLVPFVLTGTVFLANPLIMSALVLLAGKIADRLFGRRVAALTMLLTVLSTFLLVMGGTFMAHPFCALMTLAAVYFYMLTFDSFRPIYPVVSGFAIGWLMMTRPQNALFVFAALAFFTIFRLKEQGAIYKIILFGAGLVPWLAILLVYNSYYTGDPLIFKQDVYFNYSEPRHFCHRFGIGSGCPGSNWTVLPVEGLTWSHAVYVTFRRLSPLITNTLSHPYIFGFIVFTMLAWIGNRKEGIAKLFLAGLFLFTATGYFFFYFDGNVYGPRYYYEVTFFLVILMAKGIAEFLGMNLRFKGIEAGRIAFLSLFTATVIFEMFFIIPPLFKQYSAGFWHVDNLLKDEVKKRDIHNSVIFVAPEMRYGSGFVAMRYDDFDKNDNIYLIDLGEKPNSAVMHYYKNRKHYLARYDDQEYTGNIPVITPVEPYLPPNYIVIEMEDKRYPLKGSPDYCNVYPERRHLMDYVAFPELHFDFSKLALYCRFKKADEFYTFGQYFELTGNYGVDVVAVTGPVMGRFKVLVDGRQVGELDFRSADYQKQVRSFSAGFSKGFHLITFEPVDVDPKDGKYFFIDFIEFAVR